MWLCVKHPLSLSVSLSLSLCHGLPRVACAAAAGRRSRRRSAAAAADRHGRPLHAARLRGFLHAVLWPTTDQGQGTPSRLFISAYHVIRPCLGRQVFYPVRSCDDSSQLQPKNIYNIPCECPAGSGLTTTDDSATCSTCDPGEPSQPTSPRPHTLDLDLDLSLALSPTHMSPLRDPSLTSLTSLTPKRSRSLPLTLTHCSHTLSPSRTPALSPNRDL